MMYTYDRERPMLRHHRYTRPWPSVLISLARVGVPVEALWALLQKLAGAELPADTRR